jgi:acyl-CoA synthetase (AMP-forming)/AMP-acid ligase II
LKLIFFSQVGCTPFPISTRNSASAVAHLYRITNVHHVFVSEDAAVQSLNQQAIQILAKDGYRLETFPIPRFDDLYNDDDVDSSFLPSISDLFMREFTADSVAIIFHSSGTSAFPKPIKILDRNLRAWGVAMCTCIG